MRTYRIRDTAGAVIAEHVRIERPDGKKGMAWRLPGHPTSEGLMGLSTPELPLYGAHLLTRLDVGQTVIVTEGEKAAEALWSLGVNAVGTVTGASSTPGEDALSVLLPFDVVLWPDHDQEGRDHMARIAALLVRLGGSCRLLRWQGATEKGDDAADFVERGGRLIEVDGMIAKAQRVEAVYREPAPAPVHQRYADYGDADARRQRARAGLVEVVVGRLGNPRRSSGRSWFWCCPFHDEKSPSFKVDIREPFFKCFGCGARGDVFSFLQRMDGRTFKETLAELAPAPYNGILGRYAE